MGCCRSAGVAFVTHAARPGVTDDDRLVADVLTRRGVAVHAVPWDDAHTDWTCFDAVVLRSCWDYHLRPAEFLAWIDRVEADEARLWNPPAVARWNADKRYLQTLAADGVPVVPTAWVPAGTAPSLARVLADRGWQTAVVKPAVSASAHETWRTDLAFAAAHQARFARLADRGDVLVQAFQDAIVADGELSLVFLGGAFSHAVLKRPAAGDFRVQSEHGGSATPVTPPADVVRQARAALDRAPGAWLYARVDGCVVDGAFVLVELELLEPSLFLGADPDAPRRLADAIAAVTP